MKKVAAVLLMMTMILSWGLLSFADDVPGQVLLAESFESGNSSSIIAGSAKSANVNAGSGYRGKWTFTTKANSASADGSNSMGIDASSAATVPMNGTLVDGYFFNFVSLHNGTETIYAGDIVFSSVMAKLTDDSTTKTVYVRNRMNTADRLTGIVETSDYFASQYPVNASLKETLNAAGGWHGGTDEMWNQSFPVTELIPVTASEWTPVRFTMYCKTPYNTTQSKLVNQLMVSDNAGIKTNGRTRIKESALDTSGNPVYTVEATLLLDDNIIIRVPATAPLSAVYPVAYGAKITQEESNLTAEASIYDVNAYAAPSAKYQWQRKVDGTWTNIQGATSAEYVCTEADSEKEMRCQVYAVSTATDAAGVTSEVSSLSNDICSYTPVVLAPKVGGDPEIYVVSDVIADDEFIYTDSDGNKQTMKAKTILSYCKIANYTEDITSYGIKLTIGDQLYTLPGMQITENGDFGIRAFGTPVDSVETVDDYTAEGYFEVK